MAISSIVQRTIFLVLLITHSCRAIAVNPQEDGIPNEFVHLPAHNLDSFVINPLPHMYISEEDLPHNFCWNNINNVSYLTKSLNQHVPQWCGSCWAHGALSALADRIKVHRQAQGDDINLSIQYILNCGSKIAGSCHGGTHSGVYHFIFQTGYVPYDTCQPYLACSSESKLGFCPQVNTSCSPENICKTCDLKLVPSRHPFSEECRAITVFPNATIAEFGVITHSNMSVHQIKSEIFARGPVAAAVNGRELHNYHGGVYRNESASRKTTHVVEIVGWETNPHSKRQAWICRNSWGQYWGEMSYFRIELGKNILGIEHRVAWATPGQYTESNYPCWEDGKNCGPRTRLYVDPSNDIKSIQRRLRDHRG